MSSYSTLDDFSLIDKTKNGDSNALLELSARHSGVYIDRLDKTGWTLSPFQRHEAIKQKDSFIYDTACAFDPTKGSKFSSFLSNRARWDILTKRTEAQKNSNISSLSNQEEGIFEENETEAYEKKHAFLLDFALNANDERINFIMRMRSEGHTFHEIGEEIGLSHERCRQLYVIGAEKIRKKAIEKGLDISTIS